MDTCVCTASGYTSGPRQGGADESTARNNWLWCLSRRVRRQDSMHWWASERAEHLVPGAAGADMACVPWPLDMSLFLCPWQWPSRTTTHCTVSTGRGTAHAASTGCGIYYPWEPHCAVIVAARQLRLFVTTPASKRQVQRSSVTYHLRSFSSFFLVRFFLFPFDLSRSVGSGARGAEPSTRHMIVKWDWLLLSVRPWIPTRPGGNPRGQVVPIRTP